MIVKELKKIKGSCYQQMLFVNAVFCNYKKNEKLAKDKIISEWEKAKKEDGENAHKKFRLKGWEIEKLANTQIRKNTFNHKSINDFAEFLLYEEIQIASVYGLSSKNNYPHPYYFYKEVD